MNYSDDNAIWSGVLDGRYRVWVDESAVVRIEDMEKDNSTIFVQNDRFTFEPRFGPDLEDVTRWQRDAARFIDNEYKG